MGCTQCFIDHPAGEQCLLPGGLPNTGETLTGKDYGPLLLVRKLGAGVLGTVYLAEHSATGTHFAVKVLHPHLAANPAVRERFYVEANEVRRVVHPNVTRLLDLRPAPGGHHCLLMEYVEGTPFSRLQLPLPPEEAVALLAQALEGLEAAHEQGVVHGDIKPDNLVLTTGPDGAKRVKLLDFGMAGPLSRGFTEEELAAGMVVGSPAYVAPELWVHAEPDARADVYALAVVGYRLLTGKLPFGGGGRMGEMLMGQKTVRPLPPHVLEERVPPALSTVLQQALSLRPDARFSSARAFRAALTEALRPMGSGSEVRRPGPMALRVRVEDPLQGGMRLARVCELTEEGLLVSWDGLPPPLAAQLQVELSFSGWTLNNTCDVVRVMTLTESLAESQGSGFSLLFSKDSAEVRRLVERAASEPAPDPDLAQLLTRASLCSQDPYSLLSLQPHADFAEVLQRAAAAERRLEPFREKLLPEAQRKALDSLRLQLDVARRTLGDPLARAGFDATRGNFRGVARCLAAGISQEMMERLRQAFLSARPEAEDRARALFDEGILLEAQRVLDIALARYAEALTVDPLNASMHRYYQSLHHRLQTMSADSASAG
jgi:serine/threonine-protein kinase